MGNSSSKPIIAEVMAISKDSDLLWFAELIAV
jgi:hypothetical protein